VKRYRICRKYISEKEFYILCKYTTIIVVITVIILKELK